MRHRSQVQNSTNGYSFVSRKGPACPGKPHQQKEDSSHYTTTATRAPIPPATRAAACVGIVAAKFDVEELELEDLLAELLPVDPDGLLEVPPDPDTDVPLDDDPVPDDPMLDIPVPEVVPDDPVGVVLILPPYEGIVLEPVTDGEVGGGYTTDDGPPPVVLWDTETGPVGPPGGP